MENLHIAKHVLDKLGLFVVQVDAASIDFVEVTFPTWAAPFRLHLRGVRFSLRQRNMPQVCHKFTDSRLPLELTPTALIFICQVRCIWLHIKQHEVHAGRAALRSGSLMLLSMIRIYFT